MPVHVYLLVLLSVLAGCAWLARTRGIVWMGKTLAGWTSVHDDRYVMGERIRVLEVAGTYQSATYLDKRWAELVFPYHRLFEHAFDEWLDSREPRTACVLGGGGYALPKHLVAHHPELTHIDVIELDPAIERIARRHFYVDRLETEYRAVSTGRLCLHVGDARSWLASSSQHYDLILNDCFLALEPEASLMSADGARLVAQHLSTQGVYLTNVVSALQGPGSHALSQVTDALQQVFSHVWIYPCSPDDPTSTDNNIVIATNGPQHFYGAWPWPPAKENA